MDKNIEIKEFKIGYTKKYLIFMSLTIIVFTIAALYFIFNADNLAMDCRLHPSRYCFYNPITFKIYGCLGVYFFTILFFLTLFKYIKNPLILTTNETGIILPEGFVDWNDILKVTLCNVRGTVILRIKVKACSAKYLRRDYNVFQKFLALHQEKNTFSYPVSGINVDIEDLYGLLRLHIENVQKRYY